MMDRDFRYCPVCNRLLLKQDKTGFVLILHCDQCTHYIHEDCYLEHHQIDHELIGIIPEEESQKDQMEFYWVE